MVAGRCGLRRDRLVMCWEGRSSEIEDLLVLVLVLGRDRWINRLIEQID